MLELHLPIEVLLAVDARLAFSSHLFTQLLHVTYRLINGGMNAMSIPE
jgi:hypothetical protein